MSDCVLESWLLLNWLSRLILSVNNSIYFKSELVTAELKKKNFWKNEFSRLQGIKEMEKHATKAKLYSNQKFSLIQIRHLSEFNLDILGPKSN